MIDDAIADTFKSIDPSMVSIGSDIDGRFHTDITGVAAPPPRAVLRPRSTEDVARILRICHEARIPVTTQGGMTGLVRATLPEQGEVVLSMERMNGIDEVDIGGGVVVAQAGVTLQNLQERVEREGYMFPLDLASRGSCTVGGNIATNAGGIRVIRYGMMRDLVLGLEVVLADGTILKSDKKYIKNNTGYDVKQFFVGSEGTLGLITRAVLRIFPSPAERQVAFCALESFDAVKALMILARRRLAGDLTAFEVMWNRYYQVVTSRMTGVARPLDTTHPFYVLFEASGSNGERLKEDVQKLLEEAFTANIVLNATISESVAAAAALWDIRERSFELRSLGPGVSFDVSLPIESMEQFGMAVEEALKKHDEDLFPIVFGHAGDGNLHVTVQYSSPITGVIYGAISKIVYSVTGHFNGSISAEHGIGKLKRDYLPLSRTAEEINVMKALKSTLDPRSILNPGRIF